MDIHNIQLSNKYLNLFNLLSYIILSVLSLTLNLIIKLQTFCYFTIGFLYVFLSLVSVSISWSNILKVIFPERPSANHFYIITFIDVLYSTYYLHILLLQHGDIEINPGPPKEKLKSLSCFHWNVQFTSMTFFVYLRCTLILWF